VSRELIASRAATLFPPSPHDPWPAPDPVSRIKAPEPNDFLPGEIDPFTLGAVDGYLACQQEFKSTVMRMLQGDTPLSILAGDLKSWQTTLLLPLALTGLMPLRATRRNRLENSQTITLQYSPPSPADIDDCLDMLWEYPDLTRYPQLVHLGLFWIRPFPAGSSMLVQLAQGAIMLLSGHKWAIHTCGRSEYFKALQQAFGAEDASAFAALPITCDP